MCGVRWDWEALCGCLYSAQASEKYTITKSRKYSSAEEERQEQDEIDEEEEGGGGKETLLRFANFYVPLYFNINKFRDIIYFLDF